MSLNPAIMAPYIPLIPNQQVKPPTVSNERNGAKSKYTNTTPTDKRIQGITKASLNTLSKPPRFLEKSTVSSFSYIASPSVNFDNLMDVDSSETNYETTTSDFSTHFPTPFPEAYTHLREHQIDIFHLLNPLYNDKTPSYRWLEHFLSKIPPNNPSPSIEDIPPSLSSFDPDTLMNFSEDSLASSSTSIPTCSSPVLRRKLPAKYRPQVLASPFQKIPRAILDKIINFIPRPELFRTPLVCKLWKTTIPTKQLNLFNSHITNHEFTDLIKKNPKSIISISLNGSKKITSAFFSEIAKLQNLRDLFLVRFSIAGLGFAKLNTLQNLRKMDLSCCSLITREGWAELAQLQNLRNLTLDGCTQITHEDLAEISKLQNLRELSLGSCIQITSEGIAEVAKLKNLRSLFLNECVQIADAGVVEVAKMQNLEELDLSCSSITNAGLEKIAKLQNLKKLFLINCREFTNAGLAKVANLHNLEELDLSNCEQITDEGLEEIAKLPNLRKLFLSGCHQITDAGLAKLTKLRNLEVIVLNECNEITDAGLAKIAKLPNLKALYLSGCDAITDAGLAELTHLYNLEVLDLSGCNKITNARVAELAKLENLRELSLGKGHITRAGINQFTSEKNQRKLSRQHELNTCPIFPNNINPAPLLNIIESYLSEPPVEITRIPIDALE